MAGQVQGEGQGSGLEVGFILIAKNSHVGYKQQ